VGLQEKNSTVYKRLTVEMFFVVVVVVVVVVVFVNIVVDVVVEVSTVQYRYYY